ncbi:hypothetical protein HB364_21170 [Pseudoflavitalea sp. X16]|uniref:hypothetical protein n=1 Tax=Paraflavitalea devenefica TaxID=2716334 RepID=UPI00141EAADB|nr:hypothetical protein [Paraflavitalea devenefica]NII27607.1 hypothetical protein [Paraflavitalea devenefica]
MGKLISNISNYPLSEGAVAYSNKLLLQDGLSIRTDSLKDYLKIIFELSKDVHFFNDTGASSHSWNDLLKKDIIFQLSRFVTISATELHDYFTALPQINGFTSDVLLTADEYKKLAWQRFQVLQYLFWFYKTMGESINGDSLPQVLSILKSDTVSNLFIRYNSLLQECLVGPPVLIQNAHKVDAPAFNGIVFPPVDDGLTTSLAAYYNPANGPGSPVLTIYANDYDKIKAANEYAYTFFRALMQVQQMFNYWATNKLQELSTTTNTHEPHIVLLIVFGKLVMLYDAQYNQLIHKNTAFVFSDILQLKKQPILADTAYVSLELAKNVNQYFLARNTLFKAGKNSAGKTLYYQSTKDMVLNSAKIAAIKSSVRVKKQNELFTVMAAEDAANVEWQANSAWIPFNDLSESYTGMGIESKMLTNIQKKDTVIDVEFEFDNDPPACDDIVNNAQVSLLLSDGTETALAITAATINGAVLKFSAKIEKDLKVPVKTGVNIRLKLASPATDSDPADDYGLLYKFLLKQQIAKIRVKLNQQTFAPSQIQTSFGLIDGATSFAAFGAQSLAGAAFRIDHPFIKYAKTIDITLNWAEKVKVNVPVTINGANASIPQGNESSTINDFNNNNSSSLRVRLETDHIYTALSTLSRGNIVTLISTPLPRVLLIKSIELSGTLEELVYEKENTGPLLFIEEFLNRKRFMTSLFVPFANKYKQKQALLTRHLFYRIRLFDFYYNNLTTHLYPFGEKKVNKSTGLTFLPDYSILGFNDFAGDLYIGLTNITPGQSISLLFDIAEETAEQSEQEAKITWHFITDEKIEALDPSRIIDTTNNFLQPGIVQLTLPTTATHTNNLVYGANTYWLIARCDKNYDVVANIRSIKTNGVAIERVFDANNQEAKKSVAPATIENIYPKTANVKSVTQDTPSLNGRETETDQHYFWRSSQRLRHKNRGINQWDVEQLILEQFSNIYKVKCLNHAFYDDASVSIVARPAHTLISLIPYYLVNAQNPNFQPAIPMSKLSAVKSYIESKTSAFLQFQVLNARWDVVTVELEAVANKDIQDLLFYRDQLNRDIMKFFSPWAFEASSAPALSQKIFAATLIDFIDELPYVHHIKTMKILRNGLEVFDEIESSSAIHLLTSANEHTITVLPYGS